MRSGLLKQFAANGSFRSGLIAILVVQILFWFLLLPAITPADRPHNRLKLYDVARAELSVPDWNAVQKAAFAPIKFPYESCCKTGYQAVRSHFDLNNVPDEGLAIVPVLDADNFEVRVNGSLIFGEGRMALPHQSYDGLFRGTIRIPSAALKVGKNEVVFTLVRGPGTPFFYANDFAVGEYRAVKAHYQQREFMLNEYTIISITIAYLVAALAFIAWLRGGRNPYLFWLMVLAVCWALRLTHDEITDPILRGKFRLTFLTFFMTLMPIAWLNLADSWDGNRLRWVRPVSLILFALAFGTLSLVLWMDLQGGMATIDEYSAIFSGLLSLGTVLLFLRKFLRAAADRSWELAIYVLFCTLMVRDALHVFLDVTLGRYVAMELVVPMLLAALAIAFLGRNVRLFQSSEQINTLLQTQLTERTAELEAAHGREKELVRAQAHQSERQRILRDMHDGLGSQLMSMLLAARRGIAKPATVAEGLQSVIDEMRLLIDSMDSVGESLGSAFAMFRERVQGRVEEAGIAFNWQDHSDEKLPDLGPRAVLQVFRIMQEAVTNALKHSDGDAIGVTISKSIEPEYALRISIADNGKGMGKANPRGKGLESMAARAASIGGKLDVQSTSDGVRVFLDLPGK